MHHTLRIPGNDFAYINIYKVFVFLSLQEICFVNFCSFWDVIDVFAERENDGVVVWNTRRSIAEESAVNSSLLLAEQRTHRKDPLDNFKRYTGGWNISNQHYWAVSFS